MWPITRLGAVQKLDAVPVCNKGEGCAKMTTVQDCPGATFSCLPMSLAWVCDAVEDILSAPSAPTAHALVGPGTRSTPLWSCHPYCGGLHGAPAASSGGPAPRSASTRAINASRASTVSNVVACPETTCSTRPTTWPAATLASARNCTTKARCGDSDAGGAAGSITRGLLCLATTAGDAPAGSWGGGRGGGGAWRAGGRVRSHAGSSVWRPQQGTPPLARGEEYGRRWAARHREH